MPSSSRRRWLDERGATLDHFERALRSARSSGPGSRAVVQQLVQSYVLAISGQFQGFCRDLHDEAVRHVAGLIPVASLADLVGYELVLGRRLNSGNPNPGNLGADFGRLGLGLWSALGGHEPRIETDRRALESLNVWRNAIAHQDLDPVRLGGRTSLTVLTVRQWRATCDRLTRSLDAVVRAQLVSLGVQAPWPVR